jgi:DNA-binding MurR/RpiR family transcriptional regulator
MKVKFRRMARMKDLHRSHADATEMQQDGGIAGRVAAVYAELPAGERRLADVVLESASELPGLTAAELAERSDVSAATAVRFFRRLGFANYAEVRRAARRAPTWPGAWGSPLTELAGLDATQADASDFGSAIAQDMRNLAETAAALKPERIASAVALLAQAPRVWLVGYRNSAALAAYACNLLTHVRPDVRLLPRPGQSLAEDLVDMGAGDAVVVFGFRRRPVLLDGLLAAATAAGARTLLLADPTAACSAARADVALLAATKGHGMFDSYAAPISLINHLAAAVGLKLGSAAEARLAAIEDLHGRVDTLISPARPGDA